MCSFSLAQIVIFLRTDMAFYNSLFKDSDWACKGRGGEGERREVRGEGKGERKERTRDFVSCIHHPTTPASLQPP